MNHLNSKEISNGILRALAIVLGICLLIWFLLQISSVIIYIALAGVISLIGRPLVRFLKAKLKFKNTLATLVTMGILIGVLLGIVRLFVPLIKSQGDTLALLNYNEVESHVNDLYVEINSFLISHNINLLEAIQSSNLLSKLDINAIPELFNTVLSMIGSMSIGLFSVLFLSFFFLKDSKLLEEGVLMFTPKGSESKFKRSFDKIKDLLSRYFIGLVIQISLLFIIYTILLFIVGVKNALVIAFLCALLNLIPYVGPIIGCCLMLLLTISSYLGADFQTVILPKMFYILIGYGIAQLVDNFISQPLIFSNSVKSHPLEIFLIILIGGILFGITGMIIAVPTYTAIKVILKEFLTDNKIVKSITKDL